MRKWLWSLLLLIVCVPSASARERAFGWCENGGVIGTVSGLNVTPDFQGSYPGCIVTVYLTGTTTLATLYADNLGTPLANPFQASLTTGYWFFYADNGRYDVQLSGTVGTPFTLSDIVVSDPSSGGGGGGGGPPFKGPNPWADITAFGARAVGITVYPHTTVAPGGCVAGSPIIALLNTGQVGTAIFQTGDGITLYGCGFIWNGTNTPASTPTAPTVTNVVSSGGTALGGGNYSSSINATDTSGQGATTDNYEIVAADKFGGYTAVSAPGSTTTGQAALGLHTCTISTESLSGATITVNFASACYVSPGAMVHISGTSVADFTGWYALATANGGFTQFTITNTPFSTTALGGGSVATSSTGGTLAFYYSNHLKWTPVSGAWQYFIYAQRGGSGSYVLIGKTQPSTAFWTEVQFDDYGSPYMDNQTYPAWLPTTPPVAAAADPLVTTLVNGANTTTLTVAAAAITSSSGGIATFDDALGISAACTSVQIQGAGGLSPGTCFIPTSTFIGQTYGYPIFSYLKMPSTQIKLEGTLFLHAPLEVTGTGWDGYWSESGGGQFSHTAGSVLTVMDGGLVYQQGGSQLYNLTINENGTNGGTLFISDGPSNIDVDNLALIGNSNNNDYLSQCILIRTTSSGGTEVRLKGFTCNLGPNQVLNKSWTPAIYIPPAQNGSGGLLGNQAVFFTCTNYCNFGVRGTIEQETAAGNGGTWVLSQVHSQGLIGPQMLFGNSVGLIGPYIDLNTVLLDTSSTGTIASVGNGGTVAPIITALHLIANSTDVGGIPPPFTGHVPIQSFLSSSATGDIPNYTQFSSLVLPQSMLGAVNISGTNIQANTGFLGVSCGPVVYDVTCAGADPTGVADSLAAFNFAHNFFNGKTGGTITCNGTFKLSNSWIITNPGLTWRPGGGQAGYRALSPIQDGACVMTGTANLNVPNPSTAITVACSNSGGSLAAATYYVTYTLVNGSGETLAAPVSTSCTTTGATGSVTLPHTGGVPYQMGGWAFNVYVSTDGTSAGCTGPGYTTCWKQPSGNFANSGGANGGVPFLVGNGQDETLTAFSTGTTHPPGTNTASHAFVLVQVGTDPASPVNAGPTIDGITFLDTSSVLGGGVAVVNAQRTVVRNSSFEGFNFNGSAMGGQATYQQGGIGLAFLNVGNASTNNFPALQRGEFYNNILGFYSEASDVAVDGGMTNFTVPANGLGFDWAGGGIQMRQFHCSGTGSGQVACGSMRGNNNGGAYSGQFTGKAEGLQNYTGPGFKLSFVHNLLLDVQCIGGSAVANSCVQLESNSTANNIRISYQTTGIPFSDGTTALKDPAGGNNIDYCNASGCGHLSNAAAGTVAPSGGLTSSGVTTTGAPFSTGSTPTLTGTGACATFSTQVGGQWNGIFTCTGTTGAATITITFSSAAAHGYNCDAKDETTTANTLTPTVPGAPTTTCTFSAAAVTNGDVIRFFAFQF